MMLMITMQRSVPFLDADDNKAERCPDEGSLANRLGRVTRVSSNWPDVAPQRA